MTNRIATLTERWKQAQPARIRLSTSGGMRDWFTQLKIGFDHSGAHHRLQFHHVFAKALLECIPTDAELLQLNAYKEFLAERRKLIAKRLNAFLAVASEAKTVAEDV